MQTQPTAAQTAASAALSLQVLEHLNDDPAHVFALTFNPQTKRYMMLRLDRVRGITAVLDEGAEQPATFRVMLFSAGLTPEIAARDALRLRLAPESTVDSSLR